MNILRWKDVCMGCSWNLLFRSNDGIRPKEWHAHDFYEVFLACENITHMINDERIDMKPGTLVMVRPADRHYFISRQLEDKRVFLVNLAFPCSVLEDLANRYFDGDCGFWGGSGVIPEHIQLSSEDARKVYELFSELFMVDDNIMELEWILINILHITRKKVLSNDIKMPYWLQDACEQMRHKNNLRAGLKRFFKLCGRCPEHVSRELKKHTSLTPSEFVNKVKVEYASRLLSDTTMTVFEISIECGFNNLTHFYSNFKKYLNSSPRAYRKANYVDIN